MGGGGGRCMTVLGIHMGLKRILPIHLQCADAPQVIKFFICIKTVN